ncbi:unnamed protein product [Rotaria sp. Silwood1]|nr:unnamed protein product [Rotaria sp. Silwood1]CAF3366838.1 unnamed protein product [Rotaria sp. Silwood1]CAF3401495.1 unnamed protein product [Rotaria sp. Silwood1]CAF4652231.1 unnamed protein product [Rotaria sp. Silwood1]CAF4779395.1 unnamed protein product [Rotaria sp. Silwood1]
MSSDQKTSTTTTASTDVTSGFQLNQKKLKELAEQANAIKIGGKGTARRKKKIIHRPANADDKKLQSSLKKLAANNIQGIEEVNMFKDNGEVIHFSNPKVQASLSSNTFAISGHSDTKSLQEMLPTIMSQMGMSTDSVLASEAGRRKFPTRTDHQSGNEQIGTINEQTGADADDEEVPDLVENFDEVSNTKTIYEIVQMRLAASRFAAYRNRTNRFKINALQINKNATHAHQNHIEDFKHSYNRFLNKRFRAIIIVCSSTLTCMIIVVLICIIRTYIKNKSSTSSIRTEQTTPLNPSRQTNKTKGYSHSNHDTRKFSRKPRTLPVDV